MQNATEVSARDLMKRDVARLDAGTPVDEAISLLQADGISGAPVVDGGGRVVGVFSLTDVARAKEALETTPASARHDYYIPEPGIDDEEDDFSAKTDYSPEALPSGTVSDWMSDQIVSVRPVDSVHEVCRRMSEHGVHRVLVLENGSLVGILSSLDVVRWVAKGA